MKEAYYFSHDSNARNDEKILMLRAEHGLEGYGAYWILIEMMFESADTSLCHDKVKGIAYSNNIDITVLQQIIDTAIAEGLFDSDGVKFWSESLRRRKDIYRQSKQQKSDAGKKGMAKRWGYNNTVITEDNEDITKHNKGKERKGKEKNNSTSLTQTEDTKTYNENFERIWNLYPNKVGKGRVSDSKKKELYKLGDEIDRCIRRYVETKEDWKAYQNGSTFFNSGYIDYTDENFKQSQSQEAPLGLQEYDMSKLGKREEGWQ